MRQWDLRTLIVVCMAIGWESVASGAAVADACRPAPFCVGAASVDITPAIGAGQHRGRSTGAVDPLHAKALVFRQGNQQAALVVCDVCKVWPDLSEAVRREASGKTGIPLSNISITATHTHTGPLYREDLDGFIRKIAKVVIDADTTAWPVVLQTATVEQQGIAFNRRYFMKNGAVRFNPGFENPDVVRPAGPTDPDVGFLLFRTANDQVPIASLTTFAMHLDTVGGLKYSADYPFFLSESLREELGEGLVSVFGTGPCGNVNHFDVSGPRPMPGHEGVTRHIGGSLGTTIRAALPDLATARRPCLAVGSRVVHVPFQRYSKDDLVWARQVRKDTRQLSFLEQMKRDRILSLEAMRKEGETMRLEVQVLRLSEDVAIVTLPGEIFVELGIAVKQGSPFPTTLVIELANDGSPNYIPNRNAFSQGGYEVINSRLAPGGGEMLVAAALQLLKELAPESEEPQAP